MANERTLDESGLTGSDILKVISLDDNNYVQYTGDDDVDSRDENVDESSIVNADEQGATDIIDDAEIVLQAHCKDVFSLACFGNRWLASGGEDDCAFLFDLEKSDKDPILRISDHTDSVTCVKFNATGKLLATGDMHGRIVLTDVENKTVLYKIDDCGDMEWMDWHITANMLFCGCSDGMIWMWLVDYSGVRQSKVYPGGSDASCTLGRLLSDGKRLLAGYYDGSLRIWSLAHVTSSVLTLPSGCLCADIHADSPIAAVGTKSGMCYIIGTDLVKILREFGSKNLLHTAKKDRDAMETDSEFDCSVECVRFCPRQPWLAVGSNDGTLAIYDWKNGATRHAWSHNNQTVVTCIWYSSQNDVPFVLSACYGGFIRIWDARNGEHFMALSGGGEEIFDVAIRWQSDEKNSKRSIISACAGGKIRFFNLPWSDE